jgi:two-component system, NarL family, response regulator DesR
MAPEQRDPDGGRGGLAVEQLPLRVLCVEDLRIVAEAISAAIDAEPDMRSVGILPTPETLARETRRLNPDIVLFDLYYGAGRAAFDDLAGLRSAAPHIAVIVISGDNHPATIERALAAGARGYVVKSDMREVIEAIRAVAAGGTWRP